MPELGYREKCLAQKINTCNACGVGGELLVHHINGDDADHRLENLVPLCRSCHAKVHFASAPSGVIGQLRDELPESAIRDTKRIPRDGFIGLKVTARKRKALKEIAQREDTTVSSVMRETVDGILDEYDVDELLEACGFDGKLPREIPGEA